jgi:hypothetical protein
MLQCVEWPFVLLFEPGTHICIFLWAVHMIGRFWLQGGGGWSLAHFGILKS